MIAKLAAMVAVAAATVLLLAACPNPLAPASGSANEPADIGTPSMAVYYDGAGLADGDAIDFGVAEPNNSAEIKLVIKDEGSADLTLTATPTAVVAGTDIGSFEITHLPDSSIAYGNSSDVRVQFRPTTEGTKEATLTIQSNDPSRATVSFVLTGECSITPKPRMSVTRPGGGAFSSGASYNYPSTLIGTPRPGTYGIENIGTADLVLTGGQPVTIGGTNADQFEVTTPPATPIAPGEIATFVVDFAPDAIGDKTATLSIPSNDPFQSDFVVTIEGTAVSPEINVHKEGTDIPSGTTGVDFGTSMTGEATDLTFVIQNLGTAALNLTGPKVEIEGPDAVDFSVKTYPDATVAAEQSSSFTVTFLPLSVGAKTASVTIPNDDRDESSYVFNVAGTGVDWHGTRTLDPTTGVGEYAAVATLPADPDSVYVSFYDRTNGNLKFAKSTDGGITWSVDTIGSLNDVGQYTSIATSSDGQTVNVSYFDKTRGYLMLKRSLNGGSSWESAKIVDSTATVGLWTSLATYQDRVNLVYRDNSNADLRFARSTDAGMTWPTSDVLVDGAGLVGFGASLRPNGDLLYVSYIDTGNHNVKFARSPDGGNSWTTSIATSASVLVGDPTSIAGDYDSNWFIGYRDSNTVRCTYSSDDGDTWSTGVIVDTVGQMSGAVSLLWEGAKNLRFAYSSGDQIRFAKSYDGGVTWPLNYKRTIQSGISFSETVSMAESSNIIYIVYRDGVNEVLKIAKSLDGGATW